MLFVGGEHKVVQDFAAGHGRVVTQERMDQPGSVRQLRIVPQDEPHGLAAVEHLAAPAYDAVDQFDALADLSRLARLELIVTFFNLLAPLI
jgi:hypothetical protein